MFKMLKYSGEFNNRQKRQFSEACNNQEPCMNSNFLRIKVEKIFVISSKY